MVGKPKFIYKNILLLVLIAIYMLINQVTLISTLSSNMDEDNVKLKQNDNVDRLILSSLPLGLSNVAVTYFVPGGNGEILLTFSRFGSNPQDYELLLYSTDWNTPLKVDSYNDDNKIEISHIIDTTDPKQVLNDLWKVEIKRSGSTSDNGESWSLDMIYPEPWLDFPSYNVNNTNFQLHEININSPGKLSIVLRDYTSLLTDNVNNQICSPCNNINMYLYSPGSDTNGIGYVASADSFANPERIRSFVINSDNLGTWHIKVDMIVGDATNYNLELGFVPDVETTTSSSQPPTSNGNPSNGGTKISCLGAETTKDLVVGCTQDEWSVIAIFSGGVVAVLGFFWKFVFRRGKKQT